MRSVREVIVVEGRYDVNTVKQAVNCTVLETGGFRVFSDRDKVALLRKIAETRGIIILTDSDKAGFFIRGRLGGMLGKCANVKHAYIPDIIGRERRKQTSSKEGKLGVEGMRRDVIIKALEQAGATFDDVEPERVKAEPITKADFYTLGYTGGANSTLKRRELTARLGLPERLSANGLLEVLNVLYTRDEFFEMRGEDNPV